MINLILKELNRELKVRKQLYPKWIEAEKIKPDVAQHRIDILERTIAGLQRLQALTQEDIIKLLENPESDLPTAEILRNLLFPLKPGEQKTLL